VAKSQINVAGDAINLEVTTTTAKDVNGDEVNLEVIATIAKDVSEVDYVLDCLNDNRVGDDLKGNDECIPRTKGRIANESGNSQLKLARHNYVHKKKLVLLK
jgi:hypothetical protein